MEKRFLKVSEIAKFLGVSGQTVRNYINRGLLRPIQTGLYLIDKAEFDRFVREHCKIRPVTR